MNTMFPSPAKFAGAAACSCSTCRSNESEALALSLSLSHFICTFLCGRPVGQSVLSRMLILVDNHCQMSIYRTLMYKCLQLLGRNLDLKSGPAKPTHHGNGRILISLHAEHMSIWALGVQNRTKYWLAVDRNMNRNRGFILLYFVKLFAISLCKKSVICRAIDAQIRRNNKSNWHWEARRTLRRF